MKIRTPLMIVALLSVTAAIAIAATYASVIFGGHRYQVRAVKVGGDWYLDARDLAAAMRGGAYFDPSTRTLYSSVAAPRTRAYTPAKITHPVPGAPWTSNGAIAGRVVSLSQPPTVRDNEPDPGAHFVAALIEMKNQSAEPQALYDSTIRIMSGSAHINEGQIYETNYEDVAEAATPPRATHRYIVVFEVPNDAAPDIILIHPNLANGPDLILHIKMQ